MSHALLFIYLDNEIIAHFREQAETAGVGYQTLMNQALKKYLQSDDDLPVSQGDLRRILREELSVRSAIL